ncbi:hypothetical protein Acr_05g0011860 [Actinidia rufa]|uniref:Uncharacterized protein n=1 Tax=Actinidia rufa TaxID=165716 RepID=A0A7J0EPR2_9ERIC|nr:hypothetical protein Acr_05g0011860 [Actinidia rufa]
MASRSNNSSRGKREAKGKYPLIPRTSGERGTRLLADAQREIVDPYGQRPSQSLPVGDKDCRDAAIKHMQAEMEELRLEDDAKRAKQVIGTSSYRESSFKQRKESAEECEGQKRNQWWRCAKHKDNGHRIENCQVLKSFLDQLVQAMYLNEFVDQEKTKAEKTKVRPNLRFDQEREDADNALEEVLPIGTIHMIGSPHDPELENRIWGKSALSNKKTSTSIMIPWSVADPRLQCQKKEVQFVEEGREVLQDVGKTPEDKVAEDLIHYELDELRSDYYFFISSNVKEQERIELIEFLNSNIESLHGRHTRCCELNVIPKAQPMKQRGRGSTTKHVDTVIEEVEKLKEASVIIEFKKYLTKPPLLSIPDEAELLYVYLVVSEHAVSLVLLRKVNGNKPRSTLLARGLQIAKWGACR